MLSFKGMRFPIDVILVCVRWYVAYPLSYRHLEEMMEERGVSVDHSSINRWAIRFLPLIEKMAHKYKRRIGASWRMDETYIKVKGVWKYLYRAVDKQGKTVDFRPMLNFKLFRSAGSMLAGIELMHMIRKGQFALDGADAVSFADQFSALAGMVRPV
ncbi:IS6 family transposase [Collimonas fungivorans]|uniref:IS6 family transposase n=1 Tax=Collimonas fungivorans TaxID=158899 RepID=UPI003FA3A7DB